MKKLLYSIILCCLFPFNIVKAQIGLQISSYLPQGNTGYFLKPGFGAEFHGRGGRDIENAVVPYFLLGYYVFSTKQDTFPAYSVGSSSGGSLHFTPGYEVYSNFSLLTFGLGVEWKVLNDLDFSPLLGTEFLLNSFTYSRDRYDGITSISGMNSVSKQLAIGGKVGACALLSDHFLLTGGLNVNYFFATEVGRIEQFFLKPFLGLHYYW